MSDNEEDFEIEKGAVKDEEESKQREAQKEDKDDVEEI